jgi:copper chaperone CopZ
MRQFTYLCFFVALLAGCSQQATQSQLSNNDLTPASFNKAGAPTVEFSVPDMMCPEGCGAKVKEILSKQPGAKDVLVDFPNKTAVVAVDKKEFDSDKAIAALVDHQFNHSALKTAKTAATP